MYLLFDLVGGDRARIDPARVEAVAEQTIRTRTGEKAVAELSMRSGVQLLVLDPERTVMDQIAKATQGAEAIADRIASALEAISLSEA